MTLLIISRTNWCI